jgi:hypothetical protein
VRKNLLLFVVLIALSCATTPEKYYVRRFMNESKSDQERKKDLANCYAKAGQSQASRSYSCIPSNDGTLTCYSARSADLSYGRVVELCMEGEGWETKVEEHEIQDSDRNNRQGFNCG